ncbi:phospholipase/carboxylesterase [Natronococcus amylolyticus DSM 10524]|uniref:Phospholipase/carboxylesterase n=1 Tax=Natronococcus amylolyticus DSM 10524 TaxID=1227497 RepID=L9XF04_9EURY|nr:dienelactone hydrolase family protein [Natronococcus amylolyticus]ELY60314.1 phospholipase/carboxylesterase [Natronococcus amylolyticus DSM 10524]
MSNDPHGGQPIERAGADLADASAAMILVHGRGARARGMLGLAAEIGRDDVAYLAPQAARGTWYPNSFLADLESNQPHLESALGLLGDVLEEVTTDDGDGSVPLDRTVLLGFSQGGCLATEYAARNADRYGGVVALSGGLIGPEGTPREYDGAMDGTSVFVGCGDQDPHIPVERVEETARTFEELEADVEKRIYEGVGHTVLEDELEYVRSLVDGVAERPNGDR